MFDRVSVVFRQTWNPRDVKFLVGILPDRDNVSAYSADRVCVSVCDGSVLVLWLNAWMDQEFEMALLARGLSRKTATL